MRSTPRPGCLCLSAHAPHGSCFSFPRLARDTAKRTETSVSTAGLKNSSSKFRHPDERGRLRLRVLDARQGSRAASISGQCLTRASEDPAGISMTSGSPCESATSADVEDSLSLEDTSSMCRSMTTLLLTQLLPQLLISLNNCLPCFMSRNSPCFGF